MLKSIELSKQTEANSIQLWKRGHAWTAYHKKNANELYLPRKMPLSEDPVTVWTG